MIPPLLRKNTEQRAPLKKSDVCVFGGYPGEGSKRDLRNSGPTKKPSLAVEVALRARRRYVMNLERLFKCPASSMIPNTTHNFIRGNR